MIKLAVIGDPIEHSLSPKIHSFVMEQLGVSYTYQAVQVKKGELPPFIDRVRSGEVDGFNITMPHKVDIIPFLDWIDRDAEYYNSVNTVKNNNGKLCGYNTDGGGFVRSLKDVGVSPNGAEILFFGAGGVVNTLSQKLTLEGASKIVIANEVVDVAESVCEMLTGKFSLPCEFADFSPETLAEKIKTADIVINATPLGMSGFHADWENCDFLQNAKSAALVADLNYNPRVTKLLAAANKLNLKTLNGLRMLIYQALLSDEIYLSRAFRTDEIVKGLSEIL